MTNSPFVWTSLEPLYRSIDPLGQNKIEIFNSGGKTSYTVNLPAETGSGYIELVTLNESASMLICNACWQKEVVFLVADTGRVRFNFGLELDITMAFEETMSFDLHEPSWRFINNLPESVIREHISAGSKTVWVTLCFEPEYLVHLFGKGVLENPQLKDLFTKPDDHSVYQEHALDYRLNQIVSNITLCHLDKAYYLQYLESKTIELICLVLDNIAHSQTDAAVPVVIKERDRKSIKMAQEIIHANLAEPPNVRELCLMIGMNRNKLYYGFRKQFGMSMARYIQEQRLIEAHHLLTKEDMPLSQVAMNVGFKHQSSFSTAFKSKYGVSPKSLRGLTE